MVIIAFFIIIFSSKDYKEFLANSIKVDLNKLTNSQQSQISTAGMNAMSKENFVLYNSALQDAGIVRIL